MGYGRGKQKIRPLSGLAPKLWSVTVSNSGALSSPSLRSSASIPFIQICLIHFGFCQAKSPPLRRWSSAQSSAPPPKPAINSLTRIRIGAPADRAPRSCSIGTSKVTVNPACAGSLLLAREEISGAARPLIASLPANAAESLACARLDADEKDSSEKSSRKEPFFEARSRLPGSAGRHRSEFNSPVQRLRMTDRYGSALSASSHALLAEAGTA